MGKAVTFQQYFLKIPLYLQVSTEDNLFSCDHKGGICIFLEVKGQFRDSCHLTSALRNLKCLFLSPIGRVWR
jgi:hypothetical protein